MSETPDTTRPWGNSAAGNGVEAMYLWALDEIKALHARIDAMMPAAQPVDPPAPPEEAAP